MSLNIQLYCVIYSRNEQSNLSVKLIQTLWLSLKFHTNIPERFIFRWTESQTSWSSYLMPWNKTASVIHSLSMLQLLGQMCISGAEAGRSCGTKMVAEGLRVKQVHENTSLWRLWRVGQTETDKLEGEWSSKGCISDEQSSPFSYSVLWKIIHLLIFLHLSFWIEQIKQNKTEIRVRLSLFFISFRQIQKGMHRQCITIKMVSLKWNCIFLHWIKFELNIQTRGQCAIVSLIWWRGIGSETKSSAWWELSLKEAKDTIYCKHASWSHVVGSSVPRAAMLRRGRNGRVRHAAWSETRQETDVLAMIQTSSWEERDGQAASQVRKTVRNKEHHQQWPLWSCLWCNKRASLWYQLKCINIKLAVSAVHLNLRCMIKNWFH